MPKASMLPNIDAKMEEIACKTNPLGVKGIGESRHHRRAADHHQRADRRAQPLGVDRIDMPATPLRVWEAIQRAEKAKAA